MHFTSNFFAASKSALSPSSFAGSGDTIGEIVAMKIHNVENAAFGRRAIMSLPCFRLRTADERTQMGNLCLPLPASACPILVHTEFGWSNLLLDIYDVLIILFVHKL